MKVHYSQCPVCGSQDIHPLLTVTDHSVSKEEFNIWQCGNCTLRFTQDVPDAESIVPYYKSQDYISHTNTDKGLLNKLYKKVRNHTLEKKAKLIQQYTKSKGDLLDVGAGTGAFLNTMQVKGWNITGLEPDEGARSMANKLYGLKLLDISSLETLPSNSFDVITLWHVLEHIHNLHGYFKELQRLLKKDGRLFIAVPNFESVDASIYKSYWAAYDVPRHLYHFSPRAMEEFVKKHEMRIEAKLPMWFDSFYISLLSSKYRSGRTKWVSALANGLYSNFKALLNKDRCSSIIYVIH
jgi:2-polyprenyl-3-methyl-5-hydroxy-6-metoxy-1,4-benzoquinol methylase